MSVSLPVAIGDIVMASDHNNLRIDLLDLVSGHVHDGINAKAHVYLPVTPAGLQANGAIYLDNTLNTSYGIRAYSNIGNTATQALVDITTANATFNSYALKVTYAGTSSAVMINNSAGTGMGLYVYSSQGASQVSPLVSFKVVGGGTFDCTLLYLENTSVGIALEISNSSTNYGLKVTSGIGATAAQALVEFNASNPIFGKNVLNILSSGNKAALAINASACSPLNIPTKATAPTNVTTHDIYLDSGANTGSGHVGWRRYTGSAWEDIYSRGGNYVFGRTSRAGGATGVQTIASSIGFKPSMIIIKAYFTTTPANKWSIGTGKSGTEYCFLFDGTNVIDSTAVIYFSASDVANISSFTETTVSINWTAKSANTIYFIYEIYG
jgi:hypothetical protein